MHQIRYFLAVARTLNFTRASEECAVSQPSLSRAIQTLEAELGGGLFQRERGLTHLTDLGVKMLPLVQRDPMLRQTIPRQRSQVRPFFRRQKAAPNHPLKTNPKSPATQQLSRILDDSGYIFAIAAIAHLG